ncbi:MAG: pyruvate kinase [bacterium]|nr:pyruvate kinase [bacterium]
MNLLRRTKIVATLGPASQSPEILRGMIAAGVNVVRLNFSHGTPDEHAHRLESVRRAADEIGVPLGVLVDLPGAKIRVGDLPGGMVDLAAGDQVVLSAGTASDGGTIPVDYSHLADDVRPGQHVFMQDGELDLVVRGVVAGRVHCTVEFGGRLRERAGVNLPGATLSMPAVTEDDLLALAWGITHGVDFAALSFIESADDIKQARRWIEGRGRAIRLVAKIERRRALDQIEEIVAAADGVMIARGDLAVETSIEEVPVVQKAIIGLCNRHGKPVITATQMLESMVVRPRPTRAEAADVANAVFDGTDALMLSGETAIGRHPVGAVTTMASIAARAEEALPYELLLDRHARERVGETGEAIALAACQAAEAIGAAAIVAATGSGSTARRVSRLRPRRPIVAVTHTAETLRQLSLTWGVWPVLVDRISEIDALVARGIRAAVELGIARPGDQIVVTAGLPIGEPGTTNFLKVVKVEG